MSKHLFGLMVSCRPKIKRRVGCGRWAGVVLHHGPRVNRVGVVLTAGTGS